MNLYFTITLALGVTIDSFIVGRHIKHRIFISLFLVGLSHFIFFFVGLHAGDFFYKLVGPFMHWLAFLIFAYLTYDAIKNFFMKLKSYLQTI
jgi:putative Mn2+ efflux pump MntP